MVNRPSPNIRKSPYDYEFIEAYIMEHGRKTASWIALGKKYKRDRRNVQRWFERAEERGPEISKLIKDGKTIPVQKYRYIRLSKKDQAKYVDQVILWIYLFCPSFFVWKPVPEYLRRVVHAFIFEPDTLVLLPRKHGKTTILMCLVAWWLIKMKNSVLIIVSDYHAQKRYFFALRHIIKSKEVREKYGDLIYSDNQKDWSFMFVPELQQEMNRLDPMMRLATWKGGYVGSHPDMVLMDDVQQTVPVSKSTKERMLDDYDDNIQDIADLRLVSGTRKGLDDIYSGLFERGFLPLHEKAVEFTKGTFPTRRDFTFQTSKYGEKLLERPIALKLRYLRSVEFEILGCPDYNFTKLMLRYWRNPNSFYSQMQNLPRHKTGNQFKDHWWKEVDPFERGETALNRYIYADFASGQSDESSDSCFLVLVPYNYRLFIIDIVIGKFSLDEFEEAAVRLSKLYKPMEFKFENDFAQVTSRYNPDSPLLTLENFDVFYSRGKGAKINRINALSGPFRFDHFRFYKTCDNLSEAREQFFSWNETKKGFDFLDTLSSAYSGLHKYISSSASEYVGVSKH